MAEEFPFRYVPPADPNIGRSFGRYVVRTLLGRGGMGAAYLAEHEARAHVKCVIKLVLAEIAQNPIVISRYKTETEAVSLLKHDNIVKLLDFGVLDDGQLFMCFEYIEGKSFDRYVKEYGGRLDLRKAAYFIFQLCDALQYAHDCGVIHRDLKPDNLMIEAKPRGSHLEERVKILDFGIAKVANTTEHTGSGVSMGTPRYMAPEQVSTAALATGKADVFSLATILYLVVTGKLPWGSPESDIAIYHKQQTEAPAWPAEDIMLPEVAAVVMSGLSLKPAMRPTMHEFAVSLAAAIPREGALESGTEILKSVNRSWVTSSPPHVPTLPRPVALAPGVTPLPDLAMDVPHDAGEPSRSASRSAPVQRPPQAERSSLDLTVTANARPRALAVSPASHVPESLAPSSCASSSELPSHFPATPVLAALPTGLVSQRFSAQEPLVEGQGSPSAVASEIELAVGTPGPQPYAHAELPRVVISNTQLSGSTSQASIPDTQSSNRPEPPPFVVLPDAPRAARAAASSRTKLALLGASVLAVAVVAALAAMRFNEHETEDPRASVANSGVKLPNLATTAPRGDADGAAAPSTAPPGSPARSVSDVVPIHSAQPAQPGPSPKRAPATSPTTPESSAATVAATKTDAPPTLPASSPPSPGEQKPVQPTQPAAARKGELVIVVNSWAIIWLNGKQDEAPYRATIPAGRYRLRLQHEDKDETATVVVRPGETTTVKRDW